MYYVYYYVGASGRIAPPHRLSVRHPGLDFKWANYRHSTSYIYRARNTHMYSPT